jgi:hypothetical protein
MYCLRISIQISPLDGIDSADQVQERADEKGRKSEIFRKTQLLVGGEVEVDGCSRGD